ncbi:MAG: transposase, partial [Candidatus Nitrotoga sp.]
MIEKPKFGGSAGVPPASIIKKGERDAHGPTGKPPHKFWYSLGYLPHCDTPGLLQAITFRLADSLSANVLDRILQETDNDVEKLKQIESLLDAGHGACWLEQPVVANIVEDALLHWDGQHYRLLAWCVMPNHVHVLVETREGWPLPSILHGWKSYTAKAINQHLGRTGTVWMRDYFDRYIHDGHHLAAAIAYIHGNPVKAGLAQNEWDWLYSSVGARASPPASIKHK